MRRRALDAVAPPGERIGPDAPRWGLAFSGGGIRSATVCLGLTRALAVSGHLLRFDLLSTVSGGGYTGAMLGRLAGRCADATALRATVAALGAGHAPRPTWLQWWLRANGRYLIPSGWADSVFAAALYLRNLLAIHVELALMAVLLGCVLAGGLLGAWWARAALPLGAGQALAWLDDGLAGGFVPVPLLLLPLLALPALVFALAYWALSDRRRPLPVAKSLLTWSLGLLLLLAAGLPLLGSAWSAVGAAWRAGLFGAAVLTALAWLAAWLLAGGAARQQGVGTADPPQRLTRGLAVCVHMAIAIVAAALLDRAAWWLAFELQAPGVTGLALAAAVAVLRALLPAVDRLVAGRLTTAVLLSLASLLGWLLAFAMLAFWVSLVYRVVLGAVFAEAGNDLAALPQWLASLGPGWLAVGGPSVDAAVALQRGAMVLPVLAVPTALYIVLTRRNFEFLNASSLHTFYRARLVRSYLGAANPARFVADPGTLPLGTATPMPPEPAEGHRPREVGEVMADDDQPMSAYAPHRIGAPVHLVNACINQTTDPRGGLYNRDRRGLPLTIGPHQSLRVGLRPWHTHEAGRPDLTLGQWTAISGAAFAPGLGSATRGGVSVLATLAGIRLGYWWDGLPGAANRRQRWKQGGLFDEFTASFPGTEARQAYLTDGGHAENTGVYALLVERCALIVAADCGADPDYTFGDLENLIRRARIDLDTDIVVLERSAKSAGQAEAMPLAAFGSLDDLRSPRHEARIAIATVRYPDAPPGVMLIVKPSTWSSMPADLANYHQRHPEFPQQSTTDQFFDEEQWESYYKLGAELGRALTAALPPHLVDLLHHFVEPPMARGPQGDKPAVSAPSRLAARMLDKPVATTVQLGALITAGLAGWQALDGLAARGEQRLKDEQLALKELTDLWGKLPPSSVSAAPASPPASAASAAVPDGAAAANGLAAALARAADALCAGSTPADTWFSRSAAAQRINFDARKACSDLPAPRAPACHNLLYVQSCLLPESGSQRGTCAPRYWAYVYRLDQALGACMAPAVARRAEMDDLPMAPALKPVPVPAPFPAPASAAAGATASAPAAAAASAPRAARPRREAAPSPAASQAAQPASGAAAVPQQASAAPAASSPVVDAQADRGACRGFTVYLQIFGPEWREDARGLREPWRNTLGASVPPIEDVLASARARGSATPAAVVQPEVRLSFGKGDASPPAIAAWRCADALQRELAQRYQAVAWRTIPARLSPRPQVIEVWLPPRAAAK